MNNLYLSLLIFIIIFSSVSLQYKIKELFYEHYSYNLDGVNAKILNDYNQTNAINSNSFKIDETQAKLSSLKENDIPSMSTKLENIDSEANTINKNEKIFNNISSFKYGETLFLSTYYWGGYILNGKKFSNKRRDNYKRIKITSTGKKNHESIKYGDYIKVPGLTNDTLRIIGGTTGNSIFPGNYFYLQNRKKNYNNLQISWCHNRGYWKNWCQQHCGNKHQSHWWWRNRKRLCNIISCDCPFKRNRQDGIFLNRNKGYWERMKFIR